MLKRNFRTLWDTWADLTIQTLKTQFIWVLQTGFIVWYTNHRKAFLPLDTNAVCAHLFVLSPVSLKDISKLLHSQTSKIIYLTETVCKTLPGTNLSMCSFCKPCTNTELQKTYKGFTFVSVCTGIDRTAAELFQFIAMFICQLSLAHGKYRGVCCNSEQNL